MASVLTQVRAARAARLAVAAVEAAGKAWRRARLVMTRMACFTAVGSTALWALAELQAGLHAFGDACRGSGCGSGARWDGRVGTLALADWVAFLRLQFVCLEAR